MAEFTSTSVTTSTSSTTADGVTTTSTEIVEETEELSLQKIADFRSTITYDSFEIVEIVKPPPMVRKGTCRQIISRNRL